MYSGAGHGETSGFVRAETSTEAQLLWVVSMQSGVAVVHVALPSVSGRLREAARYPPEIISGFHCRLS